MVNKQFMPKGSHPRHVSVNIQGNCPFSCLTSKHAIVI